MGFSRRRRDAACRAVSAVAAALLLLPAAWARQGDVIAPGEPPLTAAMVRDYGDFLCYLIGAPLTAGQRAYVRAELEKDWRRGDTAAIKDSVEALDAYGQIKALSDGERAAVLPDLQKTLLKELRAKKGDKNAAWLLGLYETAHRPLAKGDPPLTRQVSDAHLEMFFFTLFQAAGVGDPPAIGEAEKAQWAKTLAAGYPKMSAAERKEMAKLPLEWAALRVAWERAPEADKAKARAGWRRTYQPLLDRITAAAAPKKPVKTAAAAAPRRSGSSSSGGSAADYARRGMAMQMQQQAFRNMMAFQQQMHYSRMNMTANLGPSPYRFVNSAGVPY